RQVHDVDASVRGPEYASRSDAAGVVRVEVDRQVGSFLERLDELVRRVRAAEPRHVLDGDEVRPHLLQLPGEADVVLERVLVPSIVEDVARVADRRLTDRVRLL